MKEETKGNERGNERKWKKGGASNRSGECSKLMKESKEGSEIGWEEKKDKEKEWKGKDWNNERRGKGIVKISVAKTCLLFGSRAILYSTSASFSSVQRKKL